MLIEGQAFVKLQELQRDADANKNIYEQFLSRFKTTDEQRLLQSSQTKIASLATPPIRSTRPPAHSAACRHRDRFNIDIAPQWPCGTPNGTRPAGRTRRTPSPGAKPAAICRCGPHPGLDAAGDQ